MGIIEKIIDKINGEKEGDKERELSPEDFFTNRGRVDNSAMDADDRDTDEKCASSYDDDPIFIDYISSEPKKIFANDPSVLKFGYCQDILFLMRDLYRTPYGDKLENLDSKPYITDDDITWYSLSSGNGFGNAYFSDCIKVRFDRREKTYSVAFVCTSPIMVYGSRYFVYGFESQKEVMDFLVDLDREQLVAMMKIDQKRKEEREAALAEAV